MVSVRIRTELNSLKWIYFLSFAFVFIHFAFINISDDGKIERSYKLPPGVTSSDYLPNTLIIKYKKVPISRIKTFGSETLSKETAVKITYQKPLIKSGDLAVSTFADQQKIEESGLNRIFEVGYQSDLSIEKAIEELLKDESIEYAEPSFIYQTFTEPNDEDYIGGRQSYLTQVKAQQAWEIKTSASGVIIAIVDSGSDLEHVDLANNIHLNTADPINGIDDDNDGYVDNFRGWDFVGSSASNLKEDNNPDSPADSIDHGIHVSGLASAVTNNSVGIASIAQDAKLMILKVGADDNARAIYRGYDGIIYAANRGAKIINCSWGGAGGGAFGQDVINFAISKGCLVIAAAGNGGKEEMIYPAAFKGVLAVANVASTDVKSSGSSYGYHVGISAPGSNIYSTINRDRYGFKGGTSMSTPIVASAAALVLAKNPSLTGQQVGEILRLNADPIDDLDGNLAFKDKLGNGRLNVFKALSSSNIPAIRNQKLTINDQSLGSFAIGDTLSMFFDLKNILQATNGVTVTLSSTDNQVQVLNASLNTGSLATSETKRIGPFKVLVKTGAIDNSAILFRLSYNSTGYQDKEFFNVVVNLDYQNVKVNQVYTTATSNGRVGFSNSNASDGLGFIYKDNEMLYEAGLMIGASTSRVSNNVRAANGGTDNHFQKVTRVTKTTNSTAAYDGISVFNDNGTLNKLNLEVKNRVIAYSQAPDDKYVIVEYEIFNKSTAALNDIFVGLFTDWDIDESSKNLLRYDAGLRMGYTYASTPLSPYAGVKLLTGNSNPIFYPLSYEIKEDFLADGNFTIAEKFATLSNGVFATGLGADSGIDVMYVIGSGPHNIAVGSSVKVAFAFIGGDNLTDISNSAVVAQAKYGQVTTSINPDGTFSGFDVSQNFPNPANNKTSISIQIPNNGRAAITVYDLTGRKVLDVLNQDLRKGTYTYEINISNLNSGIYFYRATFDGQEKTLKMLVQK